MPGYTIVVHLQKIKSPAMHAFIKIGCQLKYLFFTVYLIDMLLELDRIILTLSERA